ncbi:MAG: TetR/AcrR family transcriptional regulator [Betaproteobacteria bacterium]|nr:TetR/AcrR family transcriptional regulator [Betaproteobacteria bacterium]
MKTAETDRRVEKTKVALRNALLEHMARQSWEQISIQEICESANVGRSTFYMHYRSKEELLSAGLNDLRDFLAAQDDASSGTAFPFLRGLLDHIAEQRKVFKTAIGRRSGHGVALRFKEMVCQLVEMELKKQQHPAAMQPWFARYLAGGIVEAMSWWVDATRPLPIREMEGKLDELVQAALRV